LKKRRFNTWTTRTCSVALPHPAKRCGYYLVKCVACGQNALVTTAGRPDDPKSLKLACRAPRAGDVM
jgi:hypothetical protein